MRVTANETELWVGFCQPIRIRKHDCIGFLHDLVGAKFLNQKSTLKASKCLMRMIENTQRFVPVLV